MVDGWGKCMLRVWFSSHQRLGCGTLQRNVAGVATGMTVFVIKLTASTEFVRVVMLQTPSLAIVVVEPADRLRSRSINRHTYVGLLKVRLL